MSKPAIAWVKTVIILCLTFAGHNALASDPFSAINSVGGGFGGGADEILEPDQAFILSTRSEAGQVVASWEIADGHYLYRDKIKIVADDDSLVSSGERQVPQGELKHDEYFGDIYVFHHEVEASLPVTAIKNGAEPVNFKVKYQGCSEISGICYPPITKDISLKLSPIGSAAAATSVNQSGPPVAEQDRIAESLKSGSSWLTILSFFGFGLLLAFTPCVFPMIPILSGIIIGQGDKISTRSAFTLSVIYVLAMAATYTAAGVVAGLFGENLQAAFQNPWILGSFAAVFVLLSLSMFGFYELQMPNAIQSRLTEYSNKQQGGTYVGVAIMGLLSALIVGPCVAAPLAGALIYIGQTGDALLGGLALFALSMGMGAPLIAIGTSAGKLMPRAGAWMDVIKAIFGVMLLGVAIWMLERIIQATTAMLLWAILFIVSSIYMGALEGLKAESTGWNRLWKGLGLILFAYGMLLLVGASAGGKDMLQPLKSLALAGGHSTQTQQHLPFKPVKGLAGLNQQLAIAQQQQKPVMLDFYADWCVSCKEMEKYTFNDPAVQAELKNTLLLQADVTDNDALDKELYQHFGIIGPPAIIFFDPQGNEQKNYRVVGYMPAETFGPHIRQALN